jgi:hypothetical protein
MNYKAKLLESTKKKIQKVYIKSLDTEFNIKPLSAKQLNDYMIAMEKGIGNVQATVSLIALCIVDDNGDRVFKSREDVEQLEEIDLSVLLVLTDACQRISGLSEELQDDMRKN